jgi:hypothetical protein
MRWQARQEDTSRRCCCCSAGAGPWNTCLFSSLTALDSASIMFPAWQQQAHTNKGVARAACTYAAVLVPSTHARHGLVFNMDMGASEAVLCVPCTNAFALAGTVLLTKHCVQQSRGFTCEAQLCEVGGPAPLGGGGAAAAAR